MDNYSFILFIFKLLYLRHFKYINRMIMAFLFIFKYEFISLSFDVFIWQLIKQGRDMIVI